MDQTKSKTKFDIQNSFTVCCHNKICVYFTMTMVISIITNLRLPKKTQKINNVKVQILDMPPKHKLASHHKFSYPNEAYRQILSNSLFNVHKYVVYV